MQKQSRQNLTWTMDSDGWIVNRTKVELCLCTLARYGHRNNLDCPKMGWVESPPFLCSCRDRLRYSRCLDKHSSGIFETSQVQKDTTANDDVQALPRGHNNKSKFKCEVYADDFILLVIPTTKAQVTHVTNATMHGIHLVFLLDK